MARLETVLRLFLSSPSDLQYERQKVAEIIDDVNLISSKNLFDKNRIGKLGAQYVALFR